MTHQTEVGGTGANLTKNALCADVICAPGDIVGFGEIAPDRQGFRTFEKGVFCLHLNERRLKKYVDFLLREKVAADLTGT